MKERRLFLRKQEQLDATCLAEEIKKLRSVAPSSAEEDDEFREGGSCNAPSTTVCGACSPSLAAKILETLTSNEVFGLFSSVPSLEKCSKNFVRLSGVSLVRLKSCEEIKSALKVDSNRKSKIVLKLLNTWRKDGVSLSSISSSPSASTREHCSPPHHCSAERKSVARAGQITLSCLLSSVMTCVGGSIFMDATLHFANSSLPVMVKLGTSQASLQRERDIMSDLNKSYGKLFVKPLGEILSGADGEILSSFVSDASAVTLFFALVMERGETAFGGFPKKPTQLSHLELLLVSKTLLRIVDASHRRGYAFLDLNVDKVVRFCDGKTYLHKLFDYENVSRVGDDITSVGTCTPSIASPEMAGMLLSRIDKTSTSLKTYASAKTAVFSLGLMLFYMANNKVSFWATIGVDESDEIALLKTCSTLKDDIVLRTLDSSFPGVRCRSLRTFLSEALKVNPLLRSAAKQLKGHFLFVDLAASNKFTVSTVLSSINTLSDSGGVSNEPCCVKSSSCTCSCLAEPVASGRGGGGRSGNNRGTKRTTEGNKKPATETPYEEDRDKDSGEENSDVDLADVTYFGAATKEAVNQIVVSFYTNVFSKSVVFLSTTNMELVFREGARVLAQQGVYESNRLFFTVLPEDTTEGILLSFYSKDANLSNETIEEFVDAHSMRDVSFRASIDVTPEHRIAGSEGSTDDRNVSLLLNKLRPTFKIK
jgi:hypothetical protein